MPTSQLFHSRPLSYSGQSPSPQSLVSYDQITHSFGRATLWMCQSNPVLNHWSRQGCILEIMHTHGGNFFCRREHSPLVACLDKFLPVGFPNYCHGTISFLWYEGFVPIFPAVSLISGLTVSSVGSLKAFLCSCCLAVVFLPCQCWGSSNPSGKEPAHLWSPQHQEFFTSF